MRTMVCCALIVAALALAACENPLLVAAQAGPARLAPPPAAAESPVDAFPAFIPLTGVTASGVAVDRTGSVYVSVRQGPANLVWKFGADGQKADFVANLGLGTIYGLRLDARGSLYAAMATGTDRGVYRVHPDGQVERLAGTEAIFFPNALAFDSVGTLYVSESSSMDTPPSFGPGGIWRIPPGSEPELWLRHALLTGTGAVLGAPVGANGIGIYHGAIYVTNTDKGFVVRIPVLPDGSPGEPEIWASLQEVPESPLAGSRFPLMPDDLGFDARGDMYLAVISRNAIVRIARRDRSQETIAVLTSVTDGLVQRAPLDMPASLAFGSGPTERRSLLVTNLGWMARFVPGPQWPGAALVKVRAASPARPLP